MNKESIIELQKIDCNCNDCKHMKRNIEKFNSFNHLHVGQEKASARVNYGQCAKFNKSVSFIPGVCQIETQNCFEHRKS